MKRIWKSTVMKMTRGKTLFKLVGDESNNPTGSNKKKRAALFAVTPKTPSNKKRSKIKSKPFVSFSTKKVDKSIRRNVFRSGGATPTKITPYRKRAEGFSAKAKLNKINFNVDSGSGWRFQGHINGKVNGWLKKVKPKKRGYNDKATKDVGCSAERALASSTLSIELQRLEHTVQSMEAAAAPANLPEAKNIPPPPPPVKPPRSFSGGSLVSSDSGINTDRGSNSAPLSPAPSVGSNSSSSRIDSSEERGNDAPQQKGQPKIGDISITINQATSVDSHSTDNEWVGEGSGNIDADQNKHSVQHEDDTKNKISHPQKNCNACSIFNFLKKYFLCIN